MYTCDQYCYDFKSGHICKHIHRIHSLQESLKHDSTASTTVHVHTGEGDDLNESDTDLHVANDLPAVSYGQNKVTSTNGKVT